MNKTAKYCLCWLFILLVWWVLAFCINKQIVHAPDIENQTWDIAKDDVICFDWVSVCEIPNLLKDDQNELVWEDAKERILAWEFKEIGQAHDLTVSLLDKNWNVHTTKETVIDEVFQVVEECWEVCKNVNLFTE
jgi:hypothetical protein